MASSDRTDKWLWAVRLFKTRRLAAEMCAAGKVKRLGHCLKAASSLHPGDVIELPFPEGPGHRTVAVVSLLQQRVGAPEARTCYEDRTTAEALAVQHRWLADRREAPRGRPTKKDRRTMAKARGFFE